MSEAIHHHCGIAFIRFRKPLQYYIDKYGSPLYGMERLFLLMQKQHNRGQDGTGLACMKVDLPPGDPYIHRYVSSNTRSLSHVFEHVFNSFAKAQTQGKEQYYHAQWMKEHCPFMGELLLGHLRYGTHGENGQEACHPFIRENNWKTRQLVLAGNFNMTNNDRLFDILIELGQHPKEKTDAVTVIEKIGHFLDEEVQRIYDTHKYEKTQASKASITAHIEQSLDLGKILQRSCKDFDGGYVLAGVIGHGAAFIARDPAGIRPAYYYADEDIIVAASEKPPFITAFGIPYEAIQEIPPAHALLIDKDARYELQAFMKARPKKSCSFERIYFSRASDPEIYQERKRLGHFLVPAVLEAIPKDLDNTVFSYIPNTSEVAFLGLMEGITAHYARKGQHIKPRVEQLLVKDMSLRTFITQDSARNQLVSNIYDVNYQVTKKGDTLVVIDDSIVRGTTLEKSILQLLSRLQPQTIVIVSSAPQIRYPDCYGIDMSRIKDFIAFRALMALLEEENLLQYSEDLYQTCHQALKKTTAPNHVRDLYKHFSYERINDKIAEILRPQDAAFTLKVIFQRIEDLHKACPQHQGDWYFTGHYPTPGGNQVANKAFVQFMQGIATRAY